MEKIFRPAALIALVLLLVSAACSQRQVGLTSAEATALANGQTGLPPTVTSLVTGIAGTGTPLTPASTAAANQTQSIPVTGGGTPTQLCQFCMDGVAHALIAMPDTSVFTVAAGADGKPAATCNSVETLNGKQVVLCYAATPASFHMNVCASGGACSDFVVTLQACPGSKPPQSNKPNPTQPLPTQPSLPTPTVQATQFAPTDTPVPPTPTP
jgi:hypothetical protein